MITLLSQNGNGAANVSEHDDVRWEHGYHPLRVRAVVEETPDTRSYVLEVTDELAELFRYRPGQFCTFRVRMGDDEHLRSYSMSSAPDGGRDLTVTVKRVPGGLVSNWFHDHVAAGRRARRHQAGRRVLHHRRRPGGGRVLRRQRRHPGHVDHPRRAGPLRSLGADPLRQPRPRVGDLPRRPGRAGRRPPRSVARAAPPRRRVRAGRRVGDPSSSSGTRSTRTTSSAGPGRSWISSRPRSSRRACRPIASPSSGSSTRGSHPPAVSDPVATEEAPIDQRIASLGEAKALYTIR